MNDIYSIIYRLKHPINSTRILYCFIERIYSNLTYITIIRIRWFTNDFFLNFFHIPSSCINLYKYDICIHPIVLDKYHREDSYRTTTKPFL